jgi:2-methylisocitrate lyase-like PEP mutase family enzyme
MPNPWDAGSAKLLAAEGFQALATTSAGYAWTLGKLDQRVTRDELVAHVEAVAQATPLPLNVDSERCFPDAPGGVAETVAQLAEAGAAGFSVEDYDPAAGALDPLETAVARVREVVAANARLAEPMVVTARCESFVSGANDLEDTIARLASYRDAGADAVYAPGLTELDAIRRVVEEVGLPVNVLALPAAPPVAELERVGVRRVSTGGSLARVAFRAALDAAAELRDQGTAGYGRRGIDNGTLGRALG